LEENCKRILFPGAKYALPAPQDKANPEDKAALAFALQGFYVSADKADYLFKNVAGLAYSTAAQIVAEYEKVAPMPESIADFVYDYLFGGATSPCILYVDGVPKDFAAKRLEGSILCNSLQQAQDILYSYNGQKKAFEEKKRRLLSVAQSRKKKEEKKLGQIMEKLKECENGEEYRLAGELITANIYQLERGMSECRLPNYYDPEYKEKRIALDKTLTPSQNAQKYYKKYAKLKRTVEALTPRKEEEEGELAYTESILFALSQAEEGSDLADIEEELISLGLLKPKAVKQKKAAEVPFRKYEKDGFIILAGRNNVQNDKLVKSAAKNDIWLHTQKYHSSHVVIVTEGRKVPDGVLEYAAAVCARFSDGKHGSKIPVDYCEIRFVKKPSKSKAGFVVYTDYKTLLVDPLA
jgi:predicted ribosome quality control (RQC) complex YloA/Tae2 family protein